MSSAPGPVVARLSDAQIDLLRAHGEERATAFVAGPTGVGLGEDGTLYVTDTGENRITAIPDAVTRMTSAGTGSVLTSGGKLNGPLGLAIAPNDDVLTVNGGDGLIVETTPGRQPGRHSGLHPREWTPWNLDLPARRGALYLCWTSQEWGAP